MKIGIAGTRGIPNRYGGFEQFIEYVAPELVNRGHEVFVYNSSLHSYKESSYKGVQIICKTDPENRVGTAGQFIYDLNCILDSRKRNFDILLQLGYTSSSIWSFLNPGNSFVITNMDGLEWKRAKYSKPVQRFLKYAERRAALNSDALIADSKGIQDYLKEKYNKDSAFIAYGATPFHDAHQKMLEQFSLQPYTYNLLIARMEPENNIETIIRGHMAASRKTQLIVIGGTGNKFGTRMKATYENEYIRFRGPVYDINLLNNLRYFSQLYFHGHSVGGTNPSLLEAMASHALIAAHDNPFNKSVLGNDAFYFTCENDVAAILNKPLNKADHTTILENNLSKIEREYNWDHIASLLENFFNECLKNRHEKTAP